MIANTRNAAECSQVCSDRNNRFATAPVANRTAMAAEDAGALTAMENSSAHSTQKTAAAAKHPLKVWLHASGPWPVS